jgi:photosystem II stability/assembly factor-like uncharacterized protein
MKAKLYTFFILAFFSMAGYGQFTPMPLNYQNPDNYYWPDWISIVDASHVWLGTISYGSSGQIPYTYAVRTADGGNTWQFDSIPAPGQPMMSSLFAVDANTCFYVFTDNGSGGSIWKTSDAGTTWTNKTTTQFSAPGAYADFYCGFDANEGVAVGDPTLGYFEIQRTTNGGDTWSRVESSLMPTIIPGEMGGTNAYRAIGDHIWFPTMINDGAGTYSCRCFKSADRGAHWTASPVFADNIGWANMDFSTLQKGVLWDASVPSYKKYFYVTSDGGNTWSQDSMAVNGEFIAGMSSVEGIDGGFIVLTTDTTDYLLTAWFTPDFFSTSVAIDSNLSADAWGIRFKDAETGWLSGNGIDTNGILKFTGTLTSVKTAAKSPEKLAIIPNPTSTEALLKLPGNNEHGDLTVMIYDITGKLHENRKIDSTTGWTKLSASGYGNGVYTVQVVSGDRIIATTKWVVKH